MRHKLRLAAALLLLSAFAVRGTHAQTGHPSASTPRTLSYQGVLRTTDSPGTGGIAAGERLLTVSLYADDGGATRLWQRTMTVTIGSDGVFNVLLGTPENPLPETQALDRPLWLGVAVDRGDELRPLAQVTASAYALNVADNAITTAKLADNSVTASKLAIDYVGSISINGQKVTGQGTGLNITAGDGLDAVYDQASQSLLLKAGDANSGKGAKAQNANSGVALTDWNEAGNSAPWSVGGPVLGTTAGGPALVMITNNTTTLQLIPTAGVSNIIGGDVANSIGVAVQGSIIAGGGNATFPNSMAQGSDFSVIGGGDSNRAQAAYNVVGGGKFNVAGDAQYTNDTFAVVSGGFHNWAREEFSNVAGGQANTVMSPRASIGGGGFNAIGNEDLWSADYAAIGGGNFNRIYERNATIAGGDSNLIYHNANYGFIGGGKWNTIAKAASDTNHTIDQWYSMIGGGRINTIRSSYSAISGGDTNTILASAPYSTIGGGHLNTIGAPYSVIGGGDTNTIEAPSNVNYPIDHNAILGGDSNRIHWVGSADIPFTQYSSIVGGHRNFIQERATFIGGGEDNRVEEDWSSIVGGDSNFIRTDYSVIAGGKNNSVTGLAADISSGIGSGRRNMVSAGYSGIASGDSNLIIRLPIPGMPMYLQAADHSFIGGGYQNEIRSSWDAVAGGSKNLIDTVSPYSIIGGGEANSITTSTDHATLGGGYQNTVSAADATIVGGWYNSIGTNCWGAFIGGGNNNTMTCSTWFPCTNVIVGGTVNTITDACFALIGGGTLNTVKSDYGNIMGGKYNWINPNSTYTIIGAGYANLINSNSDYSVIAGGDWNRVDASNQYSAIGGGRQNLIVPNNAPYSVIPGGDSLTANSFAQTVVGYNNLQSSTFAQGTAHSALPSGDYPMFIVGNGNNSASRSNAGEWSYDGHSTVYDQNGNTFPVGRRPIYGATYNDNTIVAWGNIDGFGIPIADFGVGSVIPVWNGGAGGVYLIRLKCDLPDVGTPLNFSFCSVTATLQDDNEDTTGGNCGEISATRITTILGVPNSFIVRTFNPPSAAQCVPNRRKFFFKVCAR